MPLHTQIERMSRIFETFDDSVRRLRGHTQTVADIFDRLVMRGVDVELSRRKDLRELRSRFDRDIVAHAIRWIALVQDVCLPLRVDVLNERAARSDIHRLKAEADAEGGDVVLTSEA